ncbi:PREDICTED: UDP-glycosyltransferase 82A1-like [Camelina sativa]|uniref:Glycosyltransferase n=1 Tax=Camelina sativa TaxID=90675 RepID=A0ABM0Z6J2_CAMSA|nr:PREDICTED: UDP-glycosyltransferase 82A1-like [Camelina sativa]
MKKITQMPKILFIPYPAQGHVTPMLHLASAFLSRGFAPVVMTPESIHRRISSTNEDLGITFVALYDGQDRPDAPPSDFFSIENSMENIMPSQLERLLLEEDLGVACVVVDLLASWAIRVADRCGVPVAGFWPVMFAAYRLIQAIPELVRTGLVSRKGCPRQPETPLVLPKQPLLSEEDLPWLIGTPESQKRRFKFWQRTLERTKSLRWILVNSFKDEYDGFNNEKTPYKLFKDFNKEKNSQNPQIFHVGPLHYYQGAPSNIAITKTSLWEEDISCIGWLQEQNPNSVIYISFGSWVSPIGESNIKMLALALEASGRPFLWALNRVWQEGLPPGFVHRVTIAKNQGRIVSWSPQLEVLSNDSVGCFVTHCGWNSTMEAVVSSRRLLCYPVAGDQFVNCKYIVDVWKIGMRISGFGEKEVEDGLRKVMEDQDMGERLKKLRDKAMGNEARLCSERNFILFKDEIK